MKRYGHIYEEIIKKDNIKNAIRRASKGKRNRHDVKRILGDIDSYADKIHAMLLGDFTFSDYQSGVIREGIQKKERIIFKPKFYPDQIVHWAIILQLEPIFLHSMYEFNCGSIPNRGVHYGKRFVEKWVRTDRKNTKYFLKMDVAKFYPSIDIAMVEKLLTKKIKDKKALKLISKILHKSESGLPIGILTSQWFANFYLQGLDNYIKHQLKAKHYIRYMDDMIIFGPNKKKLHKMQKLIAIHLKGLSLKMKTNWQVARVADRGVDFMGFRFFPNKTILRRALMLRITRKAKKIFKKAKPTMQDAQGMVSDMGWVKYSDSKKMREKWIDPYINIKALKEIIRGETHAGNTKGAR